MSDSDISYRGRGELAHRLGAGPHHLLTSHPDLLRYKPQQKGNAHSSYMEPTPFRMRQ